MSKDKVSLCVLNNVLWVPSEYVEKDAEEEFTYRFEEVEYVPNVDLPSKCANCDLWGKKWRPGQTSCADKGYTLNDVCKHFTHKKMPVTQEIVIKTYQKRPDGWTTFARGDMGKIKRLFSPLGISDERVAPKLGFDLVCNTTLYEEQQIVVDNWLSKKYGILQAPTAWGKCLGRGTPVMMYDGSTKLAEDIREEDLLMGPDSGPRKVTTICKGREPLYRVTPSKGDSYVVNESHILSLKLTKSKSTDEVKVINISVLDYLKKSKWFKHRAKGWRASVDFQPTKLHPDMPPYILGIWLGEGSSKLPAITTMDPEIVSVIYSYAQQLGLEVRVDANGGRCPTYHLTSRKSGRSYGANRMINALKELGVWDNKHVPLKYQTASKEDRLQLLAGLMDSDGSVNYECYDFSSKLESLADATCFIARSLGLAAYKKPCIKTCTNNGVVGNYFRVKLSGPCSIIPCKIPRKKANPKYQRKNPLVVEIKVEPIGEGDYFGFELEGTDRLFLLGDFTVTHNTVAWSYIVAKLGLKTILLAQEVRHLMVGFEGLYEHTNLAELEEQAGEHLIGILNKDWKWATSKDGKQVRKWLDRPGKYYPITFSTFQSLASKKGKKLRKELSNYFGLQWAEECLTGSTLVPTVDRGLMRLDQMVDDTSRNQNISMKVGTRWGAAEARRWVTSGSQPTLKITTQLGNEVTATHDHKMLVLDPVTYDLIWTPARDIKEGDLLCVNPNPVVRTSSLSLRLSTAPCVASNLNAVTRPALMTPDLAFLLACIVAEGGIYQNTRVEITNTDQGLLTSYSEKMAKVFGVTPNTKLQYPKGSPVNIRGASYFSSKDCYVTTVCSKTLSSWLQELGVSLCLDPLKTAVPWSVLQADEASQLAFLAGYLECDGFVTRTGYLGFCSSSRPILHQIQAILFAHGVTSSEIKKPDKKRNCYYIRVSGADSVTLHAKLSPWIITKELPKVVRRGSKLYGIPAEGIVNLFQTRRAPISGRCTFIDDQQNKVEVSGIAREILYPQARSRGHQKILPYESIYSGTYKKLFAQLRAVSVCMSDKLSELVKLKYRYVRVMNVEDSGIQKVYDITLEDSDNRSFVANGLVSSNCHHESAPTFHQATRAFNAKYRGGQTATPSRKDQTHVAIFDTLGPVTARGRKEQLKPIVIYHATNIHVPDRVFKGRYIIPQLVNYLAKNSHYQDCLYEEVLKECEEGRKILVVTERRNQAFRLQQKLKIQGFGCELMIGGQELKAQNWYAEELLSGRISVIIGTQVINENVNIPPLDSVHQPFPNFGKEREEQRVGRIRRPLSSTNLKFLEEHNIEWKKPQPRVHVYTWYSSHNMAGSAVGFRDKLYKKWGFDFEKAIEEVPKEKRPKTMKEWLSNFKDD